MVDAGGSRLLILVPAYNEEGAIADVVRSVNREVPGVPFFVIDDSSWDATVATATAAGASEPR